MSMKAGIIFLCSIISIFNNVLSQVSIISPSSLVNQFKLGEGIKFKLGNFGEIPYGKTIVGRVYLTENSDGSNYWCELEKTISPEELDRTSGSEYTPIFIVDHSNACAYTTKAYNVRIRGGGVMLLVSDDDSFQPDYNIDDKVGASVDIPTVIIQKKTGDFIKEAVKNHHNDKVIISIRFTSVKEDGQLEIDLFFRSDDVKALHFFKEFQGYYEQIGSRLKFTPYYKYYRFSFGSTSDSILADNDASCVKPSQYCGLSDESLQIKNHRVVLLENIRQSCIYSTYGVDIYWKYMINFSELCADLNNPSFNDQCSNIVIDMVTASKEKVNECMAAMIKSSSSKIEGDYDTFNKKKVYKIPELMLNGIKYRGSWLGKYIFNAICTGFLDDDTICRTPGVESTSIGDNEGLGAGPILIIVAGIFLLMIILLICYRRIVNKSLEDTLNEKIQSQTLHSLGQYRFFKEDENTGKKTIDISKI